MAIMSGSFGRWPMSPAANPAKPAPSVSRSSRWVAGTSLAFGLACMSTNCANRNWILFSRTYARTSSAVSGAVNSGEPNAVVDPSTVLIASVPSSLSGRGGRPLSGDGHDLASVGVDSHDRQLLERLRAGRHRQRDRPDGLRPNALAHEPDLRTGGLEVDLLAGERDRLLLVEPHLRVLARVGHQHQQDQEPDERQRARAQEPARAHRRPALGGVTVGRHPYRAVLPMSVPSTITRTMITHRIENASIAYSNDLTWLCMGGNST